jgi:hypothetical protein
MPRLYDLGTCVPDRGLLTASFVENRTISGPWM